MFRRQTHEENISILLILSLVFSLKLTAFAEVGYRFTSSADESTFDEAIKDAFEGVNK